MAKNLKDRFRYAALKGAIVIGGLTVSLNSFAQKNQQQNKQPVKAEFAASPHQSLEVPAFYNDRKLATSEADLRAMIDSGSFNQEQQEYLHKNLDKLKKSYAGITEKNFAWMLENGVRDNILPAKSAEAFAQTQDKSPEIYFSPQQLFDAVAQSGATEDQMAAFIENYTRKAGKDLKIDPKGLIAAFKETGFSVEQTRTACDFLLQKQEKEEKNPQKADNLQWHEVKTTNAEIKYAFSQQGIVLEGDISLNSQRLLPQIYKDSQGVYSCGSSKSADINLVRSMETLAIRRSAMQQVVYEDLQRRTQEGEKLGTVENSFMKKHPENLAAHGLYVNAEGKLAQKDARYDNKLMSRVAAQKSR